MAEKRALIVDDDAANRSIWELVLGEHGYEVIIGETLTDGMDFASDDISLYLIDYHLPDGLGTSLIALLRENFPDAVIVTVSMDDDAEVIHESISAGSNVFMVKPTSPQVMAQMLAEIEAGSLSVTDKQLINRNGRRSYT
jgi:DNA-binding NarL/FixJ family response regulator